MFGKRKSELQKLREDYDKIVELLTRQTKQMELLIKQNEMLAERAEQTNTVVKEMTAVVQELNSNRPEVKTPEVTPRQIINEWYYTEEELKTHGTVRE